MVGIEIDKFRMWEILAFDDTITKALSSWEIFQSALRLMNPGIIVGVIFSIDIFKF